MVKFFTSGKEKQTYIFDRRLLDKMRHICAFSPAKISSSLTLSIPRVRLKSS